MAVYEKEKIKKNSVGGTDPAFDGRNVDTGNGGNGEKNR